MALRMLKTEANRILAAWSPSRGAPGLSFPGLSFPGLSFPGLSFREHDIKCHHFRARVELGRGFQDFGDEQFFSACAIEERI